MEGVLPGGSTRFRETLDHLLEGFQIIGFDWTYVYVNPAAASQGHRAADELIGQRIMDAYPAFAQTPVFQVMERAMVAREPAALENHFTYPDGTSRWFELRIQPVPEGICVFSVDIDDRKRAELGLRTLNERLESEVAERTRELQVLNRDLESFAYSVSHDLRMPLRHVSGFSTVLREERDRLSDAGRAALDRIVEAGARMDRLIDDLLKFCHLGLSRISFEPIDLGALVAAARAEALGTGDERQIEWSIGALPGINGDPALVRLVLVNLLSNALKYSRPRDVARIEVGGEAQPESRDVLLWVRDNGVGFDPRYASRLFGVFQRLHSERQFEGTGVGLAIVRRIVERHGGRVWAEGLPDAGATFYFTLPQ